MKRSRESGNQKVNDYITMQRSYDYLSINFDIDFSCKALNFILNLHGIKIAVSVQVGILRILC
jgi:hypothetical protein